MFKRLFVSLALVQLRSRGFLLSRGKPDLCRSLPLFYLAVSFAPLLLCSPAVVYAQPDSTQEVYQYVMQWGTSGSDTGQFNGPSGMCIDDSGYIYVCDRWNNRIQKFDLNGRFILTWGKYGTGQGEFYAPYDIAADHVGGIYVNDNGNWRIQKFDRRGNFRLMWTDTAGGLDCGSNNHLYIADETSPSHYESLGVYDTLGNRLRRFGNPDTSEMWLPLGVAVDDSEFIYVSRDPGNINDIIKFDTLGNILIRWGRNGTGDGQFGILYTLGRGERYKVFVPDAPYPGVADNHRVQKFTSGSSFITKWGSYGSGNGQFYTPFSVVVDSADFAYVSDPDLNRIQKFRKTIVGVAAQGRTIASEGSLFSIKCFPDPVRTVAVLKLTLPSRSDARLSLYNAAGQRVRRFEVNPGNANLQEIVWDGRNEKGNVVPSGIYFASLETGNRFSIAKITVVR